MSTQPTPSNVPTLAVLSLLFASSLWGLLWYPLRLLEHGGLPGIWTTLVAYSTALAVGGVYGWRRRAELRRRPLLILVLALAAGWCNVSFIVAVLEGTVVRVVLLFYLSPVWTVLLGRVFLGEQLDARSAAVLVLAMSGALLMLWVPSLGMPWPQDSADWLALSAGVTFSIANVLIRALQDVSVSIKTLAAWLGGVAIGLTWIVAANLPLPEVSSNIWIGAVALGLLGITVMTMSTQYGVTHMPVYRSAVILLFELVVAAASTQLLTDETISVREWLGGALIIAAALVSARQQAER